MMKALFKAIAAVLAIAAAIVCIRAGIDTKRDVSYPIGYKEYIVKYADKYDIDKYLVMGVIRVESNYVNEAQSNAGAKGLMQITDETAEWIVKKMDDKDFEEIDLFEPSINIEIGCFYLSYLIDKDDGRGDTAIAAYNAGVGNVNKWLSDSRYSSDGETLDDIPYEETKNYVIKVNRDWTYYSENKY